MEQDKEERKNEEAAKEQEENINDQVVTQVLIYVTNKYSHFDCYLQVIIFFYLFDICHF